MTICKQRRSRHLFLYAVLSVVIALFTTALNAGELSGNAPRALSFEIRLASPEEVEGWESIPGPVPAETIWISHDAALTNADVAQAWSEWNNGKIGVTLQLTEDGALKLARLTKAHVGEPVAVMADGRVTSLPRIAAEIRDGRIRIEGKFTEKEAELLAEAIIAN